MKNTRKYIQRLTCVVTSALFLFAHFGFLSKVTARDALPVAADSPTFEEDLSLARELNGTSSTAIAKISKYADTFAKDSAFAKKLKQAGGIAGIVGDALNAVNSGIKAYDKDSNFLENVCNIAGGALSGFFGLDTEKDVLNADNVTNQEILDSIAEIASDTSQIKTMIIDLDADIQEINDQLDELEEKLDEDFTSLSTDIKNLADEVKDARDEAFLNEFNQTNNAAAFGYTPFFKPNLEKRYNELLIALNSNDAAAIKQAYDNLYLVVKQTDQLYNYLTGETSLTGKRILDVLYDYSIRTDAEHAEAINVTFAQDVYATYTFATYLKTLCYHYQLLYGLEHGQEYSAYYYVSQGATANESVQYSSIESETQSLIQKQHKINETLAAFLTKVIRPNGEYGYLLNDTWTTIPYAEAFDEAQYRTTGYNRESNGDPVYYRENNQLSQGDVIALSTLPEEYIAPFDAQSFTFTIDDETQAQVSNDGILTVLGESGSFTVSYSYGDTVCYTLSFEIIKNPYAGGMGIESAPYLISTGEQFMKASNETVGAHYRLTNNIHYGSYQTSFIRRFNGVFDGNGYTVTDATLKTTQYSNSNRNAQYFYAGLFHIIEEGATVKNLNVACVDNSAVSAEINNTLTDFPLEKNIEYLTYFGILAAQNNGTIYNCHISQATLFVSHSFVSHSRRTSVQTYVGVIAGYNNGSVSACNVEKTDATVTSSISNKEFSHLPTFQTNSSNTIYAGNIIGYNNGYCGYTFALKNNLSVLSEITLCPTLGQDCASTYTGSILGYFSVNSAHTTAPNVQADCLPSARVNCTATFGTPSRTYTGFMGSLSDSLKTEEALQKYNLKLNEDGYVVFDNDIYDEISIVSLPHKRTYIQGEQLNLSGLKLTTALYDASEENAYGITVSGYDSQKLGEQTITLTWKGFSASFTVTVQCPHSWIIEGHEKSTCEKGGFVHYTCQDCGEKQTKDLLVGDHVYGEWIITKYPTPSQEGEELCSCAICGNKKTRAVARLDATDRAKIFTTAVEAISIAKNEEKLNAIKYAFAMYEKVEDKAEVSAAYEKLQTCVRDYNKHAQEMNSEFTSANKVAASVIASVFSASLALAALLFILKGKI